MLVSISCIDYCGDMAITLRQLEIFSQVAACGHVTRASMQLNLSQSAVSMAVAELERLAGAPLFERTGRRLLLNDRGRQLLPLALDVVERVHDLEQLLNESVGEPVGALHVGASTTIGNYLLPAIVGEFSRQYPRARALLHIGNARQIEDGVEQGTFDLGLIEGPPHRISLVATPWKKDELVVVAGESHPWAASRRISAAQLQGAPWLIREKGSGTREVFEGALARLGVPLSVAMELGHTEAIKKGVEEGLGVACLSRVAVQRELENGWLVEVATPLELGRRLLLLTRGEQPLTRLQGAFLALLEQNGDF